MKLGGTNNASVVGINLTSAELARIAPTAGGTIAFGDLTQTGAINFRGATTATTAGASTSVALASGADGVALDNKNGVALDANGGALTSATLTPSSAVLSGTLSTPDPLIAAAGFNAGGLTMNFAPALGQVLTLVPGVTGTFANPPAGGTVELSYRGTTYVIGVSYTGGGGHDLVLTDTASPPVVPPVVPPAPPAAPAPTTPPGYLTPATGDRGAALAGRSPQQRFVQEVYLDAPGRAGSPAELDGWLGLLKGPDGRARVAEAIEGSAEARDNLVWGWYQTYLGRAAGGGEEMGAVRALLAGAGEKSVLSGTLGSPEFFARAQGRVDSGTPQGRFVRDLYAVRLGRAPNAAEVAGHAAELGGTSQAGEALNFLRGPEFRADLVGQYYATALHRTATAAEIGGWVTSGLDANAIRAQFASSAEFFANG